MAVISSPVGNLQMPGPPISPASPFTYEMAVDLMEQIASANDGSGLAAAGTSISDVTTNQVLVTVPWSAVENLTAGNVLELKSYGLFVSPASGQATLAFNGYSNGSAGTALNTAWGAAITPTASETAGLWEAYMRVSFYSATTVQAIIRVNISSSASTNATAGYLVGNNSATPVTLVSGAAISLNAVMGSAVSGSSFRALDGSWDQTA
jgi:hypothetical protein